MRHLKYNILVLRRQTMEEIQASPNLLYSIYYQLSSHKQQPPIKRKDILHIHKHHNRTVESDPGGLQGGRR